MMRKVKSIARDYLTVIAAFMILIAFGYMGDDQLNDQLLSESVLAEIKNSGGTEILDRQGEMVAIATPTENVEVSQ